MTQPRQQTTDPAVDADAENKGETDTEFPPSCLYVRYVIDREGPIGTAELVETTGLPETTVDYATSRLRKETETLQWLPDPTDGRRKRWAISSQQDLKD